VAAVSAASAKRKEMKRDMVLYLLGDGQAQTQEYALASWETILEGLHGANVATTGR
jgi:hypothetical protein